MAITLNTAALRTKYSVHEPQGHRLSYLSTKCKNPLVLTQEELLQVSGMSSRVGMTAMLIMIITDKKCFELPTKLN